jgi:hypothetical protein
VKGTTRSSLDRVRPVPGRKDTRNWCRGKVGVKHVLLIRPNDPKWQYPRRERTCGPAKYLSGHPWLCPEQEYCVECGKITKHGLDKACTNRP